MLIEYLGMVSACAGCNQMLFYSTYFGQLINPFRPAWTCTITGSIAGMAYLAFAELCLAMRIDDPLDAFAVHFGGGLWGLISACLVTEKGILFALISNARGNNDISLDDTLWVN